MQRFSSVLAVAFLGIVGLWGCSPPPTKNLASERIRSLEENLRLANESREQFASKLTVAEARGQSLEQEIKRLQDRLEDTTRERDSVQIALRTRTAERDLTQNQYETFRKSLKEMLSQAENAPTAPRVEGALFSEPVLSPIAR